MSPGKWDGLQAVADQQGVIRAAAMDQRGSLQKSIAKAKGIEAGAVTPAMMAEFKAAVSRILTPHASAILLDPEFGVDAVRQRATGTGVLLAYEQTGYDQTQPGRIPELIADCTVRKLVGLGAHCVKLLLYYHPDERREINAIKHAFVARVGAECAHHDVPFFLECVGYDLHGGNGQDVVYAKAKPEMVARSMAEFSKPEYLVDVLKVEIPVSLAHTQGTRACRGEVAYTRQEAKNHFLRAAQAATKPFIYLSAGVGDDEFRESVEVAGEAGVTFAGVLCGRATWKDGIPEYARGGVKALEAWLADRGVRNITALNEVLGKAAKPWYAKYGGRQAIRVTDDKRQAVG